MDSYNVTPSGLSNSNETDGTTVLNPKTKDNCCLLKQLVIVSEEQGTLVTVELGASVHKGINFHVLYKGICPSKAGHQNQLVKVVALVKQQLESCSTITNFKSISMW